MAKIIFELTNLCNFSCTHCIRDEEGPKHYLDPELVEQVLEQAQAYGDFDFVAMTGGEPTLHPEFGRIVASIAEAGFPYGFVTNGWQFDKTLRQIEPHLDRLRNINFSLDGAREETHDTLRRREGSFRRIIKAISRCRFLGLPVHINMVVTTANRNELEEMAVLASRLGCEALGYGHCQPTPDGLAAELVPSLTERRAIEGEVAALQEIFQLDIAFAGDHYSPSLFYQCPQLRMEELNIDYRGYLTACCTLSNYRGGQPDTDVVADLAEVGLFEGHRRLVSKIAEVNREKLARLEGGATREADHFICTHCLEHYDKVGDLESALNPKLVQIGAR